jgi:putative FmdB family regulatory protein
MLSYSFECKNCHEVFIEKRRMEDSSLPAICPKCGHESSRIFGEAPGFILKGTGWPGKEIRERGQKKCS